MKIIITNKCEYSNAVREAIKDTTAEWGEGGLVIEAIPYPCEKSLKIESDGKRATVHYSSVTALLRAIGILISCGDQPCFKEEKLRFNSLGNMIDCSRNAVVNIESVKKLIRISALLGHNCMMLYTEDTYEIPSEKYFGHMRGRYTQAELREIDKYAQGLGIELIPCIQTLGHLTCMFYWPALRGYMDLDSIINVADERSYEFIEKMIASMSESIKSRRINIGMDEAHMLGRGKYLDMKGYTPAIEIMLNHLNRVVEICRKYGYEPMMWDDLFFQLSSPGTMYYNGVVTEKDAALVPDGVNLIYWEYTADKNRYTTIFEKHKVFKNSKVSFAGAAYTWNGAVPQTSFALNTARTALSAMMETDLELDTVLVTEWGDGGGYNPTIAALPTMTMYGEGAWSGEYSDEVVDKKLKIFGEELEHFYAMDEIDYLPDIADKRGVQSITSHYYLLYQDILQGLWDYHTPINQSGHFSRYADKMKAIAEKGTQISYLYTTLEKMSRVLEVKADLGPRTKEAYDKKDMEALQRIASVDIPECIKRMREYSLAFRRQWNITNKDFGLDVFDMRVGAFIYRLENVGAELLKYANGEREGFEELEQERLPFIPSEQVYGKTIHGWIPRLTMGRQ